jgi:hypothetical protein
MNCLHLFTHPISKKKPSKRMASQSIPIHPSFLLVSFTLRQPRNGCASAVTSSSAASCDKRLDPDRFDKDGTSLAPASRRRFTIVTCPNSLDLLKKMMKHAKSNNLFTRNSPVLVTWEKIT